MKSFATLLIVAATLFVPAVSRGGGYRKRSKLREMTLRITNQSFNQPFGGFFVMVHNSEATPLYVRGMNSSEPLATLAEDGNPGPLVDFYTANNQGVLEAYAFTQGAPYFSGVSFEIKIQVSRDYPLVTIGTMAINTNDCFISINGAKLRRRMVLDLPGLDAGSEENNENCNSIPGPGCADVSTENVRSGNGEGFVHVHRGFFGVGTLLPTQAYDWRNPMMRVVVS
jgi:hypothetical protein